MSLPCDRIVKFIRRHHVMTLATSVGGDPWCANLFYAYMPRENLFVFTSERSTKHAADALANNKVAGSIVLETKVVGRVQGVQLEGVMRGAAESGIAGAKAAYLKKFPYAAAFPLELWTIEPTLMKFTDNTLGFGKKIIWTKYGEEE